MFHPIPVVERFNPMTRQKCSSCGKDAFAYLIEADGSRIYLCLDHFPNHDAPHYGQQPKPPGGRKPEDPRP
jgi:hypothetical protein